MSNSATLYRRLIILVLLITFSACDGRKALDTDAKVLKVADILNADSSGGFSRVHRAKEFRFPEDHLAHPEYKHEWWYFTGNLSSQAGYRFGYQLTLFRIGLVPDSQEIYSTDYISSTSDSTRFNSSNWRANHFYMAHLAITVVNEKTFSSYEKFSRNALGLAGTAGDQVKNKDRIKKRKTDNNEGGNKIQVWLDDWNIESVGKSEFPLRLRASKNDLKLDLQLNPKKPVVLHGYDGLSQKGRKQGNASFYFSITRLATTGTLSANGVTYKVNGDSWYDREWSTVALEAGQRGWDWFAVQLTDGREFMYYQIRRENGKADEYSSGTLVRRSGDYVNLPAEDIVVEVTGRWKSPHSGVEYPSGWKLTVPKEQLELTIKPMLKDQEHNLVFRYWEGAVEVSGYQYQGNANKKLNGYGYVELTGYRPSESKIR